MIPRRDHPYNGASRDGETDDGDDERVDRLREEVADLRRRITE